MTAYPWNSLVADYSYIHYSTFKGSVLG